MTRHLAYVRHADGTIEDVTFAITVVDAGGCHVANGGDFRTTDGAPAALFHGDTLCIDTSRVMTEVAADYYDGPLAW